MGGYSLFLQKYACFRGAMDFLKNVHGLGGASLNFQTQDWRIQGEGGLNPCDKIQGGGV